ncbi:hypothetical protein B7P34_00830 [Streptosporangium nondiastaticum]|uniref:Uncharacterized protein n=3 Tax=Actinomycetes TaxID=1760 RepID=A0A9X7JV97_9ACTN|nr:MULTISPECIES: hypothetical protein [Actinomycetes]PSJ30588.1 hypothetical protein B7P34_00830 [Streptosporangium nondiastaticum]WKU42846.1 hypothetical protein Q3V23_01505 [Streptomyces sp. VNUA116]
MTWLPKRKHKEAHSAEDKHRRRDEAAQAKKAREETKDDVYKTPPEQDVLGWGHRKDYPPD